MTKVVVAFSGGLDTLICIDYLKSRKNLQVITYCANIGQVPYIEPVGEKSIELGAAASHLEDVRDKFAEEYILPAIRAQAVYGSGYYLGSALARPLIAKELVQVAREEGCSYLAHGGRGGGNDAIRFNRYFKKLAPQLEVIAPLDDLEVHHPGDDIDYARKASINLDSVTKTVYNVEQNLWCTNIQLSPFKDAWEEAPMETYIMTVPPEKAPDRTIEIDLEFRKGKPVALDGEEQPLHELIETLNRIGRKFAVGRIDVIEPRLTGERKREIYEQPGATLINKGYRALEELVQPREVMDLKRPLERQYGNLIYEGRWFSEEREGLDAFFESINHRMTGTVRLRVSKGMVRIVGRKSASETLEEKESIDIRKIKEQLSETESPSPLSFQ